MDTFIIETKEPIKENKNYKKFIIFGLVVLGLLILIAGILYKKSRSEEQTAVESKGQEVSMADPVDVVLDFYEPWLEAVQSISTDPYESGFPTIKILSEKLRTQLISTEGHPDTDIDPVLCQTTTPEGVRARILYQKVDEASVLVIAKEKELTAQSIFVLKRHNNGWFIDSITCSPGEFGLPREFSFEREGYLLKSVPPPFDSQHWHIVFEENGELGHVAPLFFNVESSCVAIDGSKTVCDPNQFTEATKIHAYGQMTELGVEITRLEFIQAQNTP